MKIDMNKIEFDMNEFGALLNFGGVKNTFCSSYDKICILAIIILSVKKFV